ncbi:MAG: elongation factor Ts [bacterium]|nr:elongation factor Ts [bacterium]
MAEITAGLVKELREKTGAGMMDCKRVLVEAEGDLKKAGALLRERGIAKAGKRAGRATSEGRVIARVSSDGKVGALVELNCETDFVAKTDDFEKLGEDLVQRVLADAPTDNDALSALPGDAGTIGDQMVAAIAKIGENIQMRRFTRLEAEAGAVSAYIHAGGKIGTLVSVSADDAKAAPVAALAHNVCMHVAAIAPSGLSRDSLSKEFVDREREVLTKQAEAEGKPANIIEKMIDGRLNKFFKEVVLLEQPLVMDADKTVGAAAKEAGATVDAFERFQLGEEIEE